MENRAEIRSGMTTRSADGKKLGKIVAMDDRGFTVEKGLFRKKDRLAHYEDIVEVQGDEVLLGVSASEFEHGDGGRAEHGDGGRARRQTGATERRPARRPETAPQRGRERSHAGGVREETRVPVAEEEIDVSKWRKPVGEVHLRKEVVSEQKQIEVPVMREQVRVERVPARSETADERPTLREDEISIPVVEEEIEIRKRPVVKEEIRVTKEAYQEQSSATADARREEVHVEGRGGVRRTDDDDPNKRR